MAYNARMNFRARSTFRAGSFARLEAALVPKIQAAVDQGAAAVLAESQALCPVASGELKASGKKIVAWEGRRVTGYVEYDAGHAAFVEFGTGLAGRGTYPFSLPESGTPITGSWVYDYKGQNWPGMVAQPYIRPALDNRREDVRAAFAAQGFNV